MAGPWPDARAGTAIRISVAARWTPRPAGSPRRWRMTMSTLVTGAEGHERSRRTPETGSRIAEPSPSEKDGEETPADAADRRGLRRRGPDGGAAAALQGVANGADQVGRCFMNHNASALIAIDPRFRNDAVYQKTFGLNDWYLSRDGAAGQTARQCAAARTRDARDPENPGSRSLPRPVARWISRHAIDLYADLRRPARSRKPRRAQRRQGAADLAPIEHDRASGSWSRQAQGRPARPAFR